MADEIGLFEAMHTQRALRYIRPDPIPDALARAPGAGGGIPGNVDTAALLPLGYPAPQNRYGPTNRRAVEDVTFDEGWGRRWEART